MPRAQGWTVYILRCRDGTLYTGATCDLDRRVAAHRSGRGARYVRSRLPVKVVYAEPARDRSAALRREAAIKRLTRVEKLGLVRRSPPRSRRSPPVEKVPAEPPESTRGPRVHPPSPRKAGRGLG